MRSQLGMTFVVAVNNREVLNRNLLASPCLYPHHGHQILIQENFASAALAYNHAMQKAAHELVVFIHQDMYLPESWISEVEASLRRLQQADPEWGVLGCWGATREGQFHGHVYSTGLGVLGHDFQDPLAVQTLDEIVLIVRKSSGLVFDSALPHFHFYGTDICLRSARLGRRCYVIPAFAVHNTRQILELPEDFYRCYFHIRRAWHSDLPIQTTCIRVSRWNTDVYRRKLQDLWRRIVRRDVRPAERAPNPATVINAADAVCHDKV